MKIVECVPNFSEGKDQRVIRLVADAVKGVPGVILLDVSSGHDTNRTVYTFAGEPKDVLEAAFAAVRVGCTLIDMSSHRGAHPRLGACDVCPFVPIMGVSMEECVELSRNLGKRIGTVLGIPVYLYACAAAVPARNNLEDIRTGEYEGLAAKLLDPAWGPDYGPSEYTGKVRRSGAVITGAREFLLAYNINLDTRDRRVAMRIAGEIREKGRIVRDEHGNEVRVPGRLKFCKAIGWYVEDYGRAQVSMNLTNYKITNLYHAYEAAGEVAAQLGVRVTGSEIVGLVPKEALIQSGLYYLKQAGGVEILDERIIIQRAVESLGLNDVAQFIPDEKIIEYRIQKEFAGR
jgi:glutamate formiminotransferase/formiminotetrahydrofolate cyclodeaminase